MSLEGIEFPFKSKYMNPMYHVSIRSMSPFQAHYSTGMVAASFTSTSMDLETTHEAGTSRFHSHWLLQF